MKKYKYFLLLEAEEENKTEGGGENTGENEGEDLAGIFDDQTLSNVKENIDEVEEQNIPKSEEDSEKTDEGEGKSEESGEGEEDTENKKENKKNSPYKNKDEEKVKKLFTDTGNPHKDYSINSENNKRLAKFKFKYAGIDINKLFSDQEKKMGLRVDEILSRLTPEQYEIYLEKSKELRREFPLIGEREQKIVIYNSNIPFYYTNKKGQTIQIKHKRDLANAIEKVNKFMIRAFGEDWVDDKTAIQFLKKIKIDFTSDKKIQPNLIPTSYLNLANQKKFSLFNKMYIDFPPSVKKFIEKNMENSEFKRSTLFTMFINDFLENEKSSKMSIYSVISMESGEETESGEGGAEESGESGEGGGGEEGGGMEMGGGEGAGIGGEMGGEAGGETGGDLPTPPL
ncbi:MAG: hypothetical protein NZZ41_01055 [Candidatus Dojkabacteria bacterium]|nr:hypothetical protein [Candidatus Dojkabacteria bacterium]